MNRLIMIALCILLSACNVKPRPLTFEEQEAYMAKQQCMQTANEMNPEWPDSANPAWNEDFIMCMNQFGISDAAIRRLWY